MISREERQRLVQEEYERLFQEACRNELAWLMQQPQGRRFLWKLVAATGYFSAMYKGNQQDAHFQGKRSIGEWVWQECSRANPKIHSAMHEDVSVVANLLMEQAEEQVDV